MIDLDALLLTVRDPRSRDHLGEAIRAFRSGALKAAINATWIALAYDLFSKFRELSASGDAAATMLVSRFENAIANNNVDQLLKLEGSLLEDATTTLKLFSATEHRLLQRLKEDRNLCSHPTFNTETEVFQPSQDLARMHIVHCVTLALARAPVQGKALLDQFSADVVSTAFPRDTLRAKSYVKLHYLDRSRAGVIESIAKVIAKSLVKNNVPEWLGIEPRLLDALEAISEFDGALFRDSISPSLAKIVDGAQPDELAQALPMLARLPPLVAGLAPATRMRLSALIENFDPDRDMDNGLFAAIGIPDFAPLASALVERLSDERLIHVVEAHPSKALVLKGIEWLAASGGWRTAERRFKGLVIPLAAFYDDVSTERLVAAIVGNDQVWDAAGIPGLLADFLALRTEHRRSEPRAIWTPLVQHLQSNGRGGSYLTAFGLIGKAGV